MAEYAQQTQDFHLQERITDAADIVFGRVAAQDKALQDAHQIGYDL